MKRLRLSARVLADGAERETWLLEDQGRLAVQDEEGALWPLPVAALLGIFGRYAHPLDEGHAAPPPTDDDVSIEVALSPASRATVRTFAFLGYGAVLPAHWALWEVDGAEPVAAPAPLVAAAATALARAAARPPTAR